MISDGFWGEPLFGKDRTHPRRAHIGGAPRIPAAVVKALRIGRTHILRIGEGDVGRTQGPVCRIGCRGWDPCMGF